MKGVIINVCENVKLKGYKESVVSDTVHTISDKQILQQFKRNLAPSCARNNTINNN